MIEIIPATPAHADLIVPQLRQAHLDEARFLGIDPLTELRKDIRHSYEAWSGFADGVIGAIWGIRATSLLAGDVIPWLVTTSLVERHKRFFLVESRKTLWGWRHIFPKLKLFCYESNEQSARWLAHLGFTEGEPIPGYRRFVGG